VDPGLNSRPGWSRRERPAAEGDPTPPGRAVPERPAVGDRWLCVLAQDSAFPDPASYYHALALGYEGSEFSPDMEEICVLRLAGRWT